MPNSNNHNPTHTEPISIETLTDCSYLLTAFTNKSSYLPYWQECKFKGECFIPVDHRLINPAKRIQDGMFKLVHADIPFKEFCILKHGEPLLLWNRWDGGDYVHCKLMTREQIGYERSRLACKGKQKRIQNKFD